MTLSSRYSLAFTVQIFFVLIFGFAILYVAVERSMVRSVILRMEERNDTVAQHLLQHPEAAGSGVPEMAGMTVRQVTHPLADCDGATHSSDDYLWDRQRKALVSRITTTSCMAAGKTHLLLQQQKQVVVMELQFIWSLLMVLAWVLVFLLIINLIATELMSRHILGPFHQILDAVGNYNVADKISFVPPATGIQEFRQLNKFIMQMTERTRRDYDLLGQLSENTIHELQTPLASMRAKAELMMNTPLTEQQMATLSSMLDELHRLSALNRSLALLARLDHYRPAGGAAVDISALAAQRFRNFEEVYAESGLVWHFKAEERVVAPMEEDHALLLLDNLISNAARHNLPGGSIFLHLSASRLEISNTGPAPGVEVEQLFDRFQRGAQSQQSLGIGLSLVKKIAEVYGLAIHYTYQDGVHRVRVSF